MCDYYNFIELNEPIIFNREDTSFSRTFLIYDKHVSIYAVKNTINNYNVQYTIRDINGKTKFYSYKMSYEKLMTIINNLYNIHKQSELYWNSVDMEYLRNDFLISPQTQVLKKDLHKIW